MRPLGIRAFILIAGLTAATIVLPVQSHAARKAWIVIDWESGRVLESYRADKPHSPASLTKVMTLYLVFEALDAKKLRLDQRLRVSRHAQNATPSRLGLRAGSTITVRDAIRALVTKSANDAARVLAEALGGTEARFARLMTAKGRKIGMSRTTFRNASGLPSRGQISTARDLAVLGRAIITKFPHHYHFFNTRSFSYRGRTYSNHNRLLGRYPGVDGLKTGYVRASGYNLLASAKADDGRRVVAVVLGGRSGRARDVRMTALLNSTIDKKATVVASNRATSRSKIRHTQRRATRRPHLRGAASYARKSTRSGPYAVQVGAFRSYRRASRAAYRAVRRARRYLAGGDRRIERTPSGRLYRARVYDLDRREAYRACRTLKRKGHACAVVRVKG